MINLDDIKNIYLYSNKIDMRFGIYSIQKILSLNFAPLDILDCLFIFISRDKKNLKIYYENEYGNWLFINKLKYYKFRIGDGISGIELSKSDINSLLKGVELKSHLAKQASIWAYIRI